MDENRRPGHEERDVNIRSITKTGIALALLIVGSLFLVWFVFDALLRRPADQRRVSPGAAQDVRRLPPEPRLQSSPTEDLQQMLAAEQRILNSYAWLDGNQGAARIPVSVAMDLVAQRGLPVLPAAPSAPAAFSVPSESGLGTPAGQSLANPPQGLTK
jgi:hypothetical protein